MAVVRAGRFLWRLIPGEGLRIYKWTGKNDYVALCEPEYLSFGGGCVSCHRTFSRFCDADLGVRLAGTATTACIWTTRCATVPLLGVRRSKTSRCAQTGCGRARTSASSVSGSRYGALAEGGRFILERRSPCLDTTCQRGMRRSRTNSFLEMYTAWHLECIAYYSWIVFIDAETYKLVPSQCYPARPEYTLWRVNSMEQASPCAWRRDIRFE